MKEKILRDFKERKGILDSYLERIVSLIDILIKQNNLKVHQIIGRTKDLENLSKKIDRKQDKYSSIDEITDIVGVRIITYLESDVNNLYDLITKEFTIDTQNSIDKRILADNQFGYRSLHVVVSLNSERCKLTEYKKFENLKCEIQIRSILQHAWAEIEHDLGYKSKSSIPQQYKRNFN
jgi:ppGpp synthetase/RelA/SpoT-type nucleotidyltranferase